MRYIRCYSSDFTLDITGLAYIGLIGNLHDVVNLQLAWFKLQSSPNKPKCCRSLTTTQSAAPAVERSNFNMFSDQLIDITSGNIIFFQVVCLHKSYAS